MQAGAAQGGVLSPRCWREAHLGQGLLAGTAPARCLCPWDASALSTHWLPERAARRVRKEKAVSLGKSFCTKTARGTNRSYGRADGGRKGC